MAVEIPSSFRPLRELAGKRDRLRQAERAAAAELRRLDVELAKAVELDRKAYADRLSRDIEAKSPGAKEQEKVRVKIDETKARRNALVLAVQDVDGEIDAEVAAGRAKWLASETAAAEKARRAYAEAVEALSVKRDELAARENLVRWLETPGRPYKEIPASVHSRLLLKENGSPRSFATVIDALREDAKPADQREDIHAGRSRFGPFKQPPPVEPEPEPELDRVA
jgi:hypothetical protein